MNRLIVIGAGGHGKVISEIAYMNGYEEIFFMDDTKVYEEDCNIIGTLNDVEHLNPEEYDFIVAIGDNEIRKLIQKKLIANNFKLVVLIHPSAVVSTTAGIGRGTVIMANSVVGIGSVIGEGCIINTGATVDHDCKIEDYAHISPGVHLAGGVEIGEKSWIGIGSSIINNLKITNNCILGAGSVIINDISDSGTYVGTPAKLIKKGMIK